MRLIALHGKAGAGKDTFCDRLVEKHGFVKHGFAVALYEEVAAAFGVEVTELLRREIKEVPQPELALWRCANDEFRDCVIKSREHGLAPRSPREVLQLWGTDYRRAQNKNYWLDRMDDFMRNVDHSVEGVAIRDCRFVNEAEWVHDRGGRVYEVVRPGHDGTPHEHVSEQRLPSHLIHATITNSSSLSWLRFCADFYGYATDGTH